MSLIVLQRASSTKGEGPEPEVDNTQRLYLAMILHLLGCSYALIEIPGPNAIPSADITLPA